MMPHHEPASGEPARHSLCCQGVDEWTASNEGAMAAETGYHFFYSTRSPFSNFHPAPFTMHVDFGRGVHKTLEFQTSEQAFMYFKATFFGDHATALSILKAKTPADAKRLGRRAKGFDEALWVKNRWRIMYNCVLAKFWANDKMRRALYAAGPTQFVEAAPRDRIWGIGFDEGSAMRNKSRWGLNLLGKILDAVYQELFITRRRHEEKEEDEHVFTLAE